MLKICILLSSNANFTVVFSKREKDTNCRQAVNSSKHRRQRMLSQKHSSLVLWVVDWVTRRNDVAYKSSAPTICKGFLFEKWRKISGQPSNQRSPRNGHLKQRTYITSQESLFNTYVCMYVCMYVMSVRCDRRT